MVYCFFSSNSGIDRHTISHLFWVQHEPSTNVLMVIMCASFYLNGHVWRQLSPACLWSAELAAGMWSLSCRDQNCTSNYWLDEVVFTCWFYLLWLMTAWLLVGMNEKTPRWRRGVGVGVGVQEMKNGWILKTSAKPWWAYFKHAEKFSL